MNWTLCLGLYLFAVASGFRIWTASRKATSLLRSYADELRKAQEARSGTPAAPRPPVATQQRNLAPSFKKNGDNDAPFSDSMYAHLSFIITKLSSRIKGENALDLSDLDQFRTSCDEIIRDMDLKVGKTATETAQCGEGLASPKRDMAPCDYESATEPLKSGVYISEAGEGKGRPISEADPNSPFAAFHGHRNTWQINGSDNMTTEEYYQEIYRRNRAIKDLRQQEKGFTREAGQDYLESINKKNRSQ